MVECVRECVCVYITTRIEIGGEDRARLGNFLHVITYFVVVTITTWNVNYLQQQITLLSKCVLYWALMYETKRTKTQGCGNFMPKGRTFQGHFMVNSFNLIITLTLT